MPIEVTVRHLDINDTLQTYANDKAAKLMEKFPPIEFVRVVLDKDGPFYTVTTAIQGGHKTTVESNDKHAEMLTAINAAFEKAEMQLRKHAERLQDVRP